MSYILTPTITRLMTLKIHSYFWLCSTSYKIWY